MEPPRAVDIEEIIASFEAGTLPETKQGACIISNEQPRRAKAGITNSWQPGPLAQRFVTKPSRLLKSHFNLHGLPTEIRIIIFQEYLIAWRSNSTSPLIKALRGDLQLYDEALEAFYAVKTCSISSRNQDAIKSMPPSVLQRVSSLKVWYSMRMSKTKWEFDFTTYLPETSLRHYINLTSLRLTTRAHFLKEKAGLNELSDLVKMCIINFPVLSKLTIEKPMKISMMGHMDLATLQYIFKPTTLINKCTGIQHKWVKSERHGNVALLWDAGKGKTLKWTDHTHFQNIPWGHCNNFFSILTLYHRVVFWSEDHLGFLGLNPRHMFMACPIASCVCYRIIASKAPIGDMEATDWIDIKPPVDDNDLSPEEQVKADAIYEIPEALYLLTAPREWIQ